MAGDEGKTDSARTSLDRRAHGAAAGGYSGGVVARFEGFVAKYMGDGVRLAASESGRVFKPYIIKEMGDYRVAVTPLAEIIADLRLQHLGIVPWHTSKLRM